MPRRRVVILLVMVINFAMRVHSFQRPVGSQDPQLKFAVECFASNSPLSYAAGRCPDLINCILDSTTSAQSAGLSAGASISALLPTVLALVGASPIEPMEVFFSSPLRAVAMCYAMADLTSRLDNDGNVLIRVLVVALLLANDLRQPRDKTGANSHLSLSLLEPEEMVEMDKRSANIQHRVRLDDGLWQWYEAALETLGVGIYLYGTIVLGSMLFLTGQRSIIYLVVTVLSLTASRIINSALP
ncbi:hypothetical protein IW262DRAFT_1291406 [Armillaria fumosa]|nr:hypothetical protein IW262DRAFT_1291406 [Armillaria fumosa]